jgi:hypothetical protein
MPRATVRAHAPRRGAARDERSAARRAVPAAGWAIALTLLLFAHAAQGQSAIEDPSPGFGIIVGQGQSENETIARRYGVTSRRLRDNDRLGSLGLLYEEHRNGIDVELFDDDLDEDDVELRFQTLYAELKRYFPVGGPFHVYWGLRGGYTRVEGRIDRGPGEKDQEFTADSVAPLWFLALPFVLEHPGFLLLAGLDGSSAGITYDIIADHVWLDLNIGTVILPLYRSRTLAIEDRFTTTIMLQLVAAF